MVDARRLSPGRGVARHHRVHRDRTCAPGKRCVTGRAGDGPHVRAAFVPIIGAVFAGVMAVLVALVTGGVVSAAIVGVVAIVVQQLDNDILAPWVYGRALTGPPPRRDPRERRRRRGAVRHRWHAARRTGRGGSRQRRQGTRIEACRSSCSRRPIRMRGVPMRPDLLGRVRVLVRDLVRAALDLREDPARLALEARGDE